jgi:hypothetical protein
MSEQAQATASKKPRGRSPSYPAIDLSMAIQRARQLWSEERQHPASVDTISRHWGYKSFNGPASLTLAALKKFGLVQDEGTGTGRRARVSDLAVDILENPDEAARRAAIQRAALNPAIHRELWEKYGARSPSDANLRWELTRERGFTDTGVDEFIPEYRTTVDFAQLADSAVVVPETPADSGTVVPQTLEDRQGDDGADEDMSNRSETGRRRQPRSRGMSDDATTYAVPVAAGSDVVIEGRFPLSESEWTQFMAVLNAMKPGLVAKSSSTENG